MPMFLEFTFFDKKNAFCCYNVPCFVDNFCKCLKNDGVQVFEIGYISETGCRY